MRTPAALCLACVGVLAFALSSAAPAAETGKPDELETVIVTGSRIATISREGPSPVTVITAEDITARGFTTVQEAVAALPQVTGTAQNETQAATRTFARNANGVDVRGLGPGRTLILVDGRRMTDYPLPYGGTSNFVNLSAIPAAAVERIEVLAGGASAIYGSDAVAGVINIILKKKTDAPFNVDLRYGDTTQGGGQSLRLQGVASLTSGRLSTLFAAELFKRDPIYAFQRDFQDSVQDNPDPDGRINSRSILRLEPYYTDENGFNYVDPGEAACDAFPTLTYSFRPGAGYYCGDEHGISQYTLRNARQRGSLFGRVSYELDNAELYGSLHYYKSSDRLDSNLTFFSTDFILPEGYFFDVSEDPNDVGGNYGLMQRYFQPAETGGYRARQSHYREQVIDYSAGVRGNMRGAWKYDLTLGGSEYDVKSRRELLLNKSLLDYFLGPQLTDGSGNPLYDPQVDYFPVYSVRWDRLYTPITPEMYRSFTDTDYSTASSYTRSATLVFTGDLVQLPAGPLSTAVVFEAARQGYEINLDKQLQNGEFMLRDTGGDGSRKRYAAGVELGVPVLEQVRLKLAGRYDDYNDITAVNGAFTYNVGVEYRPIRQLLVRGSHATSFRAPDMHYVFADPSGYFTQVTDEYLCRRDQPTVSLSACTIASGSGLEGARQGNPFLEEETSHSSTFGFVFQPISSVTFSVDYYDIKLKGAVRDDSAFLLLETEADCRLGKTKGGEPVDIDSIRCQSALARVARRPNDGGVESEFLSGVTTGPINTAEIHTAGLDAAAKWKIRAGNWGDFDLGLAYTQVFKYDLQEYAGDPVVDELDNLQFFDWHSRINASVAWTRGPLTSTLFVERNGSVPNWAETGRIGSYTTANLSTRYKLPGRDAYVGLAVQNLFDRNPPRDPSYDTYPYYSDFNYSPVGREVFVEIGARF